MTRNAATRGLATILIAEDSPTQAQELIMLLEDQGFAVIAARNGREALTLAQEKPPDLIISDIVMPEMDGYSLCRAIKGDARLSETPFILVTSLSSPSDVFKGLDVGADNFVVKPFDHELLISRIRYLLTNRELRRSGKLQVGIEIELSGNRHFITAERQQILDLLISTYEQAISLYDALDARQKELAKSYDTLNALYGLAEGLNACSSEVDVAMSAVERGLRLPGIHAAWFYIFDGSEFVLAASSGEPDQLFVDEASCAECKCQKLVRQGGLNSNAIVFECERLARAAPDQPLRYHACVPLEINGAVKGVFNLVGLNEHIFSHEELRTLSSIGNQIAIALERVQLRESLERKVAERTAELLMILESTPVPTMTVDRNDVVTTWNRAAENVFGYRASEIVGRPNNVLPRDYMKQEPYGAALASDNVVRDWELHGQHRDGSQVLVRLSGGPLTDHFGDVFGRVLTLEDMRERRRIEEQLFQAQKMEAIGNLTGGIAHDFNNMLTVIVGNIDLAVRFCGDNPQLRELLDGAMSACLRGADLTKQLLAFGRRQTLKPDIVDVNSLVRNSVKLLSRTLGEHITVELIEGVTLWPVEIDAAQLDSAVLNLAVNARDAMSANGHLTIETSNKLIDGDEDMSPAGPAPGEYVLLSVTDTGSGISPEVMSRIFEPFFTTKEVNKGTGLGLAMVYGFVKQSGGYINVYSELNRGTCFKIYLPRTKKVPSDALASGIADDPSRPKRRARILIVEDNDGVRQVVTQQISGMGHQIVVAQSGLEALHILQSETGIDAVFSDVVMPGEVNGIVLAEQIAKQWPEIKVLLTSGFPEAALSRSNPGLRARILNKPYRIADLEIELNNLLNA